MATSSPIPNLGIPITICRVYRLHRLSSGPVPAASPEFLPFTASTAHPTRPTSPSASFHIAILSNKLVAKEQPADSSSTTTRSGGNSSGSAVNGHKSIDLDLVLLETAAVDGSVATGNGKPNQLQKPLTITDLAPAPMHGSTLRVAYQGVPGAYSEATAGKAYPNCEAIPCDQFEVAFQAVELWIADRAVLPVENSLVGSIHRNYDLLLRHRQLPVHHCLLASTLSPKWDTKPPGKQSTTPLEQQSTSRRTTSATLQPSLQHAPPSSTGCKF
ncbi:Arogenate dehydratase 3 [Linum perenne]